MSIIIHSVTSAGRDYSINHVAISLHQLYLQLFPLPHSFYYPYSSLHHLIHSFRSHLLACLQFPQSLQTNPLRLLNLQLLPIPSFPTPIIMIQTWFPYYEHDPLHYYSLLSLVLITITFNLLQSLRTNLLLLRLFDCSIFALHSFTNKISGDSSMNNIFCLW